MLVHCLVESLGLYLALEVRGYERECRLHICSLKGLVSPTLKQKLRKPLPHLHLRNNSPDLECLHTSIQYHY